MPFCHLQVLSDSNISKPGQAVQRRDNKSEEYAIFEGKRGYLATFFVTLQLSQRSGLRIADAKAAFRPTKWKT